MKYVISRKSNHALQYYVAMPGGRSDWACCIDNATVYDAGNPLPLLSFGHTFDYRIVPVRVNEEETVKRDEYGDHYVLVREDDMTMSYLSMNNHWSHTFIGDDFVRPVLFEGAGKLIPIKNSPLLNYLHADYDYRFVRVSRETSRTIKPIE